MNMTKNKTRTITYYKLKHVDDDTKECFIYSALSIKQLMYKRNTLDKDSYIDRYIRKNGRQRKWEFVILKQNYSRLHDNKKHENMNFIYNTILNHRAY